MGVARHLAEANADSGRQAFADEPRRKLRRHDLLRVPPQMWSAALLRHPAVADVPLVADWASNDWPVIVRRYSDGDDPSGLPVALPLPPHLGKRRIALTLPAGTTVEAVAPVSLRDAAPDVPASWRDTVRELLTFEAGDDPRPQSGGGEPSEGWWRGKPLRRSSQDIGRHKFPDCGGGSPLHRFRRSPSPAWRGRMGVHVFGALLWQHLTKLPYLHEASDLDLLWAPEDLPSARSLVDRLRSVESRAPMALDGEIGTSDGGGVSWRELADAPPDGEVLVKHLHGVRLQPVSSLFASPAS